MMKSSWVTKNYLFKHKLDVESLKADTDTFISDLLAQTRVQAVKNLNLFEQIDQLLSELRANPDTNQALLIRELELIKHHD